MGRTPAGAEFALIERHFAPLAKGFPGALGLSDDAALIAAGPDEEIVATVDAIVAGVHFIGDETPQDIAAKLIRVNLSDLAAMGAEPVAYLLAIALPWDIGEDWLAGFAAGLAADQERYGIGLAGGDTVATPGPLTLSLTGLGKVPRGKALRRSGARPGDRVLVSGTLGDAALGLRLLKGELTGLAADGQKYLIERYRRPEPRLTLGRELRGLATAAIDLSDGLAADLGHVCRASGVAARIAAARLPQSPAAAEALAQQPALRTATLAGGDDYELLFTAAPQQLPKIGSAARRLGVAVTAIGDIEEGDGVTLVDADGHPIVLSKAGYSHF